MKFDDLTLGLLVLIGSIAILVSSLSFSHIPGQAYGADTMPKAIGAVGLVLAAVLIGQALAAGARVPAVTRTEWARSRRSVASFLLTVALIVAYIALADSVGFIPVAIVLLVVLMLDLKVRPVTAIVVAIIGAFLIQAAFGKLLLVPLPRNGFLEGLW